jgi:hypothetical protein
MASRAEAWRQLAAEALVAAQKVSDPEAKLTLTAIALAYERLARRAEQNDPDKAQ